MLIVTTVPVVAGLDGEVAVGMVTVVGGEESEPVLARLAGWSSDGRRVDTRRRFLHPLYTSSRDTENGAIIGVASRDFGSGERSPNFLLL